MKIASYTTTATAWLLLSSSASATVHGEDEAVVPRGVLRAAGYNLQSPHFADGGHKLQDPYSSSCNNVHQDACLQSKDDVTGEFCIWCVAGAVPSECVNPEQAQMLPQGVFDCSTPGRGGGASSHHQKEERTFLFDSTSSSRSNKEPQPTEYHLTVTHHDNQNQDGEDDKVFCDASSKSLSGYMDIKGSEFDKDGENKHLFFWMFEKRGESDENTPFMVWLTGGPGCSSSLALLTENGPCSVNDDGKTTTVNPYSWTEASHVLWLDQPAGVGFSYGTENDYNEEMIAEDAYHFLQAFFQTYPQYSKAPFFIVAESYGGHYAPAIANRILQGNNRIPNIENNKDDKMIKINLSGVGLGNGLTKPEEQYKWYPEMGHNNSHHIQVFNDEVYQGMLDVVPKCASLIHKCNEGDSMIDEFACQSAFLLCNMGLTSPYQATGLNPYDIRIPCAVPPLCYDMSHIESWFHLESTKKALGVDEKHSHAWATCNFGINMKFHEDWMKDFSPDVANVLNAGIPVLVYAGDVDFICNYLGNKAWTYDLEWKGKSDFQKADEHEYAVDGSPAGLARTTPDGLFTFLQVYDAGHMVPSDQPQVALAMIRNFVTGGKF